MSMMNVLRSNDLNRRLLHKGITGMLDSVNVSLHYLKQLQNIDSQLASMQFDESLLDCKECALAKMERLPVTS